MAPETLRDRGEAALSSVRQVDACLREAWEKEEALTQTESQEPAGRGKEEGSASDGQVEDDEETEDNEYRAMTKAMDALKPEKIVVHLTALAVSGRLACNMLTTDTCVPLGKERPFFRSYVCQVPKCTKGHEVCRKPA